MNELVSNVAADRLDLFKDGRPQYAKIKEVVDLTDKDFASATRFPVASLKSGGSKLPRDFIRILLDLGNAINLVAEAFNGDMKKVNLWFQLRNPQLGNISPRDMIRHGRFKKLIQHIYNMREGYHE
ncbi:MAG: hypothetical protein EA369_09520 [Bradymonadales bacterium]|nr:MAG: hypothetical protein EA369_09520 [Bradymonadales bacterium]